MNAPLDWVDYPDPAPRVLVVALEGWIDAGAGAATAMSTIAQATNARTIATFDPDTFLDFRARRPVLQLRDGIVEEMTWPTIELKLGADPHGAEVLLLSGSEPDSQWHQFVDVAAGAAMELGARLCLGLGAYPFAAPHTRPSLVACTAWTPELAESSGLLRNSVDVPSGAQAALEAGMHRRGIAATGLWAQVPHYASAMPSPGAALALVETVARLGELTLDATELRDAAETQRLRLDELVAQSAEHVAMVHQLEAGYDAATSTEGDGPLSPPGVPLPSGDELAAELERFLRDQGR